MPVFVNGMRFARWHAVETERGWTDVFVLEISAFAGLPPVEYALGIHKVASALIRKRPTASLWVQLEAPGRWYRETMDSVLRWKGGLPIALSGKSSLKQPVSADYVLPPSLSASQLSEPEQAPLEGLPFSTPAIACLVILARIERGSLAEIASLTFLSEHSAQTGLEALQRSGLVRLERETRKTSDSIWALKREGLSLALRLWGIPKEVPFARRKERPRSDPAGRHRRISRLWPAWLGAAWPHAQVWSGWSEISLPGLRLTPDALGWGWLAGQETLFWLEVESGHGSGGQVHDKLRHRFVLASEYAKQMEVYLVFALLGRPWVCEAARPAFVQVPAHVAVTIGDWQNVNRLPLSEWGRVEW